MGDNAEFYQKTADELIYRMSLQLGGIDTVYVSGNHDNGKAAAEATIAAGLGAQADYNGVELLNEYSEDMDIIYFFGHDHSKGEREFMLLPSDTIISTTHYDDKTYSEHTLGFAYGHAGYLTDGINGKEYYSFVSLDKNSITRTMYKADGSQSELSELTVTLKRKIKEIIPEETIIKKTSNGSSSKKAMAIKYNKTTETPTKTEVDPKGDIFSFKNLKEYDMETVFEIASQNKLIGFALSVFKHILPV